jgi:hypothetical protein
MSPSTPRKPPRRTLRKVFAGAFAAFLVVELVVRIATHSLFVWITPDDRDRYGRVDPILGRVPRPGVSMTHPKGFSIHIGEEGTRSNGGPPGAARPLTVVVGDSFAFGDEVNDDQTWPAVLEQRTGARVINGGVPGFGLDQAVLRAVQLAGVYAPDTILVSFIPHDVARCEMSYWSGHAKPFFDVEGAGIVYHPAPVVPPSRLGFLKDVLSKSVVIDRLLQKELHWNGPDLVVHHHGDEVACLLMNRLAALAEERRTRVLLVAQPQAPSARPGDRERAAAVVACARKSGLPALDLFPMLDKLAPAQRVSLFHGHMTAEGNRVVAAELVTFLGSPGAGAANEPRQ